MWILLKGRDRLQVQDRYRYCFLCYPFLTDLAPQHFIAKFCLERGSDDMVFFAG